MNYAAGVPPPQRAGRCYTAALFLEAISSKRRRIRARVGGYRYYIATDLLKHDAPACTVRRVPAAEIEGAVVDQVRGLLRSPEMIVRTWRAGKRLVAGLDESEVRAALQRLDPVWNELFPAEQARVVQLLVERVDVSPDGVEIRLRTEGLANLTAELDAVRPEQKAA